MIDPCKDERVLSALLDGALNADDARQVRMHLRQCEACRQKVADFGQTDAWIRGLPPATPSAGFDAAFWRRVASLEEKRQPHSWVRRLLTGWRPLLAAGMTASLVAGVWLYRHQDKPWSAEEQFMAQNVEFLNDLDMIRHLEMLENWETLQDMKEPS